MTRSSGALRFLPAAVAIALGLAAHELAGQTMPAGTPAASAEKRILLIADRPSHGPRQHEHNAGVHLLARGLSGVPGVRVTAQYDGWPQDPTLLENADAIFVFCTGGDRHLVFQEDRAAQIGRAAERGAGLMFFHWCTEPPAQRGHQEMLDWIGGFFELHHSVNPIWEADFRELPDHPITRGVRPFQLRDEWYFNVRFRPEARGITPILRAVPPAETMTRPDGPHSGNPDARAKVAAGVPQTVMWAYERPNGGRGVGFTGGHYHMNFGDDDFRKLVLNAVLWIAGVEIPPGGVHLAVTPEDLEQRLDPKPQPQN